MKIKRHLRLYVYQGNDIINANDIKIAIDGVSNIDGLQCFLSENSEDNNLKNDFKLTYISTYKSLSILTSSY